LKVLKCGAGEGWRRSNNNIYKKNSKAIPVQVWTVLRVPTG